MVTHRFDHFHEVWTNGWAQDKQREKERGEPHNYTYCRGLEDLYSSRRQGWFLCSFDDIWPTCDRYKHHCLFLADGCVDVNSNVRLSFLHASLTKEWVYTRVQDQRNSKSKRSYCTREKIEPKEFTLGFNSTVWEKCVALMWHYFSTTSQQFPPNKYSF